MPTVVLKILKIVACIVAVFSAFVIDSSSADSPTVKKNSTSLQRTKRGAIPWAPIISSVAAPLRFLFKMSDSKKADKVEFTLNVLTGAVTPWLTQKGKDDFAEIYKELSLIRKDLTNLRHLFHDQAMKNNYVKAEEDIVTAMNALKAYEEVRSVNLLNDFLEAAKPMQSRVQFLFQGLLGRLRFGNDIIKTLIEVHLCRTRKVCEEVSEIVTIIKAGITVEDVEKQMRNFTLNDRKPFRDYLGNATEELDKILADKLKKCRQLNEVKSQMRRILDDHADEDPKKVLDQVFGYLSDRYDQHDWFVLTYDAQTESRLKTKSHPNGNSYYPEKPFDYDFAFYEAETSIGWKHKVAALSVARNHAKSRKENQQQARDFLIESICRKTGLSQRIATYDYLRFLRHNDFHWAYFPTQVLTWTYSPGMDVAHLPYRNGSCILGDEKMNLFAIAPPYNISTTHHIPTDRSMALVFANGGSKLIERGHRQWKLVNNQLQTDDGQQCFSYAYEYGEHIHYGASASYPTPFTFETTTPCPTDNFWHLSRYHVLSSIKYDQRENRYHLSRHGILFFSEDGKRPFQNRSSLANIKELLPIERMGRPLVLSRSNNLVLTVQHNDPTSNMFILDIYRNDSEQKRSTQRWRFEGNRLINDWNNCLMTSGKELEQVPCPVDFYNLLSYDLSIQWTFQDGFIKNGLSGSCVGSRSDENPRAGILLAMRTCTDSAALQWSTDDYIGPLPPRQDPERPVSRALVNGFGLALTVEEKVEERWWLLQDIYRNRSGQRWFLHENRLHNDLGNCLYSSTNGWILQDNCYKTNEPFFFRVWVFYSSFWYYTESKQLKSRYGCLGVHYNSKSKGAWLVVQNCQTGILGQIWTFSE